ncbi:capsular exopolysaccharide family [Prosthecobacter debontii]|uniref:Capsular exopolysaccharide family n=1 Tax=Prosthecobacter debontii TaxID=48467 RepID=A0A1T4WWY4_9BACT|nr:polysaccharide biosynthesis tyrosine autokinase [Prosthecobacter debontii]SKA81804.1 capsular exopolysaccharide family [Prosthecobacter debontii]
MNSKTQPSGKDSKLDGSSIIRTVLAYEDYWRLMIILVLIGLLGGTCYFIYARATYESQALIRANSFLMSSEAAVGNANADRTYRQMRALMDQLNSGYVILEAARAIGVAGPSTTFDGLRDDVMPVCRMAILDQSHFQILVVSYDAEVVKKMPQALVDAYERIRLKIRSEYRDTAVKRYADEVTEIRKKVAEQLDSRLQFEEQSALANAQIEMERLSNIPVDIVRAKYRLKEHEEISRILQEQQSSLDVIGKLSLISGFTDEEKDPLEAGRVVRKGGAVAPFTFSSPSTDKKFTQVVVQPNMVDGLKSWQELERTKRATEEKLRLIQTKFLDDHPEVIKLKDELKQVESALDIELKVALTSFDLEKARLTEKLEELDGKLPEYHKAIKSYDTKKLDYDLMEKSQLAWDKAYEKLSQRIESLEFDGDKAPLSLEFRGFTNLRSEMPVSPNKSKLFMMGCLLGLGLAGGVPFLLRRFDSSVVELSEFEGTLGINGIGLVPLSDPKELESLNRAPTVGANVPNALLENFRLIRSSILLNGSPKGDGRVIMLTSARPSEGKTTVSSNVAWAFSSLGEKTLLIDCDLRRGRVHEVIGASNAVGMTDLLTGRASLSECVQKVEAENLWAITRGMVVPGTTELLNSGVFAAILEELKKKYDRIILDTPPVLGLSETAFLQHHADGVAIVVRCGKTLRKDVEDAVQSLQKLGAHFYGFILNGVDFSKRVNHYYYYYYSASYYDANWDVKPAKKET